jgi:HEAT repeat protein
LQPEAVEELRKAFKDEESAVRYWAALGILMRGKEAVEAARDELLSALKDESPHVRIAAAEALARFGSDADLMPALDLLIEHASWEKNDVFVAMAALNALDATGNKASAVADAIKMLPTKGKVPDSRYAPFVPQLIKDLLARLK